MKAITRLALVLTAVMALGLSATVSMATEGQEPATYETIVEATSAVDSIEIPIEVGTTPDDVKVKDVSADQIVAAFANVMTARTMGVSAIILAVIQLLMVLLRSAAGTLAGSWRITALILLTMIAGTIGYMWDGADTIVAIASAIALIPPQVTFHQLYKQYLTVKGSK